MHYILISDGLTIGDDDLNGRLRDVPGLASGTWEPLPEKFELTFIELRKFTKSAGELQTRLDQWLYLFLNLGKMREQPRFLSGTLFDKLFQITDEKNLRKEDRTMLIDHERDRRNQDRALKREIEMNKDRTFVQTLVRDTDFDDQKIAALAGVEEDFVKAIRSNMIDF